MKRLLALILICLMFSGCSTIQKWIEELTNKDSAEAGSDPDPTPTPSTSACLPGPDNRIGFDIVALQLPRQDAQAIADLLPPNVPVGWLDGTFTQDPTNVELLLRTRKVAKAIVAIFNGPGIRNGQTVDTDGPVKGMNKAAFNSKLEKGDFALRDYFKARVSFYKDLATKYPCTTFYVKPILEHDVSEKAFKVVADWTHQVWPGVPLVNSPVSGWAGSYAGSCLEKHGENTSGACASSLDGKSLYSIDRAAWRARTANQLYTLSWIDTANCRTPGKWLPPLERVACLTRGSFMDWLEKTYE